MRRLHYHKLVFFTLMVITGLLLWRCSNDQIKNPELQQEDFHSFAKPYQVVVTHMNLDIKVDFDETQIRGKSSFEITNKTGADKLYLDSRKLMIRKVTLGEREEMTSYKLGAPVEYLGQPLIIDIKPQTRLVNVYYQTHPTAPALQWLTPEQTDSRKHPFLFTQSQPVLARSWIPCQDSPGIRFTYTARVETDPQLMAVMSAENPTEKNENGIYNFKMTQPIPAYLLALAVGDIEYRSLGPTTGVYAEPSMIADAAFEFANTESMMQAAEKLYGQYLWNRYDILVLPPSFPFGGMENPRLTFVTPTIISGDRSLVALIAHELAHSWSGNLVTNATWNDLWINEGFTVYLEDRIMEAVYGEDYAEMLAELGYQDLVREMEHLGRKSPDTRLHLNLKGRDPDDAFTDVPYEKGRLFLKLLEQTVGREKWDAFLSAYFDKFAFETMSSNQFLTYLRNHLIEENEDLAKKLKLEEWMFAPGLPDNCPVPQSDEFDKVEQQISIWKQGTPAYDLNTDNWTTHHWLHFLRHLPQPMTEGQMTELDRAFHFTASGNAEILFAWFMNVIRNQYQPAYDELEEFLTKVGRRKFLRPLYEELAKTKAGLRKARRIYEIARAGYHPVSYHTIDEILDYES